MLSISEVDRSLATIAAIRGTGSAALRAQALRALFSRATVPEQQFLLRLVVGELRQGALAGVMIDAIGAAADLRIAEVRRAAMYSKSLGAVARVALSEGATALQQFQLELFVPASPMLAQTAADVGEALKELGGDVAFEWKMDGARIQAHKLSDEVRIYTRSLNEVTARRAGNRRRGARLGCAHPDTGWRGHRLRRLGSTASLSNHHAPLRPQAQRRGVARGAADQRIFLRLPACRWSAASRIDPPANALKALANIVPASHAGSPARDVG